MDLTSLFLNHLSERRHYLEQALQATRYDALVISAGEPYTYFADDADAPFRSTPHFRHYCPLEGPHHVLILKTGQRPRLIRYAPEDFWYEQLSLETLWGGTPFWLGGFELTECPSLDKVWEAVGQPANAAYIGNETARAEKAGLALNPENIKTYLDWGRAYKSDYEVHCTEEAMVLGVKGHVAGREAFQRGASELEIHQAFTTAVGCMDHELSFPSIVAINEKSATLHYETKRTIRNGKSIVIDCGARKYGYASDITRTYTAPGCDHRFQALVKGMEKIELELCSDVAIGLSFSRLHHQAHEKVGHLLQEAGILKCGPEEAIAKSLTRAFLPHGLGHHLGIQVHDVGGRLAGPDGSLHEPPPEFPTLRTTRPLEARQIITIEPGIYFIPMLLRPFRENEHAHLFHWPLIDELTPLGGIRIEDDVLLTENGPRNLTREHLPN